MTLSEIADRGILVLGCGKMGSALIDGWLSQGIAPDRFCLIEPNPSDMIRSLAEHGALLNTLPDRPPGTVLLAVKPQMMAEALPRVAEYGDGSTLFISIAAGLPLAYFGEALGQAAPVIRAMPNTPAAIGRGITALVGNTAASDEHLTIAETLLASVGSTVRLPAEAQMDVVTALSGSGPAYVFLLIEALAEAGVAEGLEPDLALELARATVAGAGLLAEAGEAEPGELRQNVTSPGGTTAAALEVLMANRDGLPDLIARAVSAAASRSRELGS